MASPIPKREEERRRRNKTTPSGQSREVEKVVVDPAVLEDTTLVPAPNPNPDWGWLPRMMYDAAKRSAIRDFYEPTDWAMLFFLCQTLDDAMQEQPVVIQTGPQAGEVVMVKETINGAVLGNLLKGFTNLMFSEGERRRLRLEIERQATPTGPAVLPPGVTDIRAARLTS